MSEKRTFGRLGVIVAVGVVTAGLAAFPAYTGADGGGNGNGNGNGGGNAHDNGNGRADDNGGDGNGNDGVDHVAICHVPPGNPDNEHTITVGEPAVDAHVDNHGDSLGPCDADTTTTTSTSTSTTTSTTSTAPAVAPDAVSDFPLQATIGQAFSSNVLTNDFLGTPLATITDDTFDAAVLACAGLSFDPATGALSGTPTGAGICPFAYVIENSAGSSAALVLVVVSA